LITSRSTFLSDKAGLMRLARFLVSGVIHLAPKSGVVLLISDFTDLRDAALAQRGSSGRFLVGGGAGGGPITATGFCILERLVRPVPGVGEGAIEARRDWREEERG